MYVRTAARSRTLNCIARGLFPCLAIYLRLMNDAATVIAKGMKTKQKAVAWRRLLHQPPPLSCSRERTVAAMFRGIVMAVVKYVSRRRGRSKAVASAGSMFALF